MALRFTLCALMAVVSLSRCNDEGGKCFMQMNSLYQDDRGRLKYRSDTSAPGLLYSRYGE